MAAFGEPEEVNGRSEVITETADQCPLAPGNSIRLPSLVQKTKGNLYKYGLPGFLGYVV